MTHIYVHLPFCLSKCIYCDFVVVTGATAASSDKRRAYLDALKAEITHYLGQAENLTPIETIYLGGGTPGLFSADELDELINTTTHFSPLSPDTEITLEINPEFQASPLSDYRAIGINRLSIGIQSLQPDELKRLSRIHSRDKALQIVHQAREAGFENLSIDLMYGIPEQTLDSWHDTLQQAITLPIQHISTYGLQVESGTPLERLVTSGRFRVADEDLNADQYEAAVRILAQAGFARYEVSNFARPGFESRHNLNTWRQGEYWAFGVGAHGFVSISRPPRSSLVDNLLGLNRIRYEHTESLAGYLADPLARPVEHSVSDAEHAENKLIFGLRLAEGVNFSTWTDAEMAWAKARCLQDKIDRLVADGWLTQTGSRIALAPHAITVSTSVLERLC